MDAERASRLTSQMVREGRRVVHAAVMRFEDHRSRQVVAADVIRHYGESGMVRPAAFDQRVSIALENSLLGSIPAQVSMVEVAPVTSFAATALLTGLSQDLSVSTTRNVEVVSDALIPLALELESRLRTGSEREIWLGTCHRELRPQPPARPEFSHHFRAFSLISGANSQDFDSFKMEHLSRHLEIYLEFLGSVWLGQRRRLRVEVANVRVMQILAGRDDINWSTVRPNSQAPGFSVFNHFDIDLPKNLPLPSREKWGNIAEERGFTYLSQVLDYSQRTTERMLSNLGSTPGVDWYFDVDRHAGANYYVDFAAKIWLVAESGRTWPVVDLGVCNWLRRLGLPRASRCIAGGMGTEVLLMAMREEGLL